VDPEERGRGRAGAGQSEMKHRSTRAGEPQAVTSLAWFLAGDYERAVARWLSLAEDWADCAHPDYCRRIQAELLRFLAAGLSIRAVAPIHLDDYLPWCEREELDAELPATRANYAAELTRRGDVIPWPPGRNDACWCGSGRKYTQCCATVVFAPDADA
jgi:hypothetical protein